MQTAPPLAGSSGVVITFEEHSAKKCVIYPENIDYKSSNSLLGFGFNVFKYY